MAQSKKKLSGTGWSFEPAGTAAPQAAPESLAPDKQRAKVTLEKRPKGKVATVVKGFALSDADRHELAAALKKSAGRAALPRGKASRYRAITARQ